jgi:hypothetical protein
MFTSCGYFTPPGSGKPTASAVTHFVFHFARFLIEQPSFTHQMQLFLDVPGDFQAAEILAALVVQGEELDQNQVPFFADFGPDPEAGFVPGGTCGN